MELGVGDRLGVYEIRALLGEGGMGRVFRAFDTKLQRQVAIKVLPESVAADPDRLMRFEREALALAALNHPQIAQIYGFEQSPAAGAEQSTISALVMELVEGDDLAERIARGPVPIEEALPIARQIADALNAAHAQGIIHRDLKPANIKLREDGTVKVLDFGLAKAFDPNVARDFSPAIPANTPTITSPAMTMRGVIIGTAAYMAPEQARGKTVDKRADIWAFGVVLFEMLAGSRPFPDGDDVVSTIASIVKEQPSFGLLPAVTPASIRRLLRRCLEKDPRQRLADIADARFELTETSDTKPAGDAQPIAPRIGRERLWQVIAVLAVLTAIAAWAWPRAPRPIATAEAPLARIDVDLGPDLSLESIGPAAILSPDGSRIAFVSKRSADKDKLFTRRLDEPTPTELAGTEGANAPFFSPDGQWIGFFAAGKLKKVRVDGSRIMNLADAAAGRGGSWSDDGSFIVAALENQSTLVRVPAEGGAPQPITKLKPGERSHRWPHVVTGRNEVVFIVGVSAGNFSDSQIATQSLDQSGALDHRVLVEQGGMYPRYAASGHLTFVSKGVLFGVPLETSRVAASGTATAMLDSVANFEDFGTALFDLSQHGSLLYHRGETVGRRTIAWLSASGSTETVLSDAAMYLYPRISPDGRQIAYALASGSATDIWVYDWRTRTKTRFTRGPGQRAFPLWTADGRYLAFAAPGAIFWVRADGAAEDVRVLLKTDGTASPTSFSPDGKTLVYVEGSSATGWALKSVPITTGAQGMTAGTPSLFVGLQSGSATTAFSPDGRWLAYTSNESGTFEVYVREFPDKQTKVAVSSGSGMMPMWSPKGKELFYRTQDQRVMAVAYVVKDGAFVAEPPRVWSSTRIANMGMTPNLDLAPDGRFVVLMPADAAESRETRGHFTLVLNFADELRRRLDGTTAR